MWLGQILQQKKNQRCYCARSTPRNAHTVGHEIDLAKLVEESTLSSISHPSPAHAPARHEPHRLRIQTDLPGLGLGLGLGLGFIPRLSSSEFRNVQYSGGLVLSDQISTISKMAAKKWSKSILSEPCNWRRIDMVNYNREKVIMVSFSGQI